MRTTSVLMPRSTSQESNGDRIARAVLNEGEPLEVLRALRHDDAADRVGMSVQELGRGVIDEVRAEAQGSLQPGRGEGVVHHDQGSVLVGEPAEARDVAETHRRIRRALQM